MNRSDSDRINDFFAAGSRDLTPASARPAAHVLYSPISADPEVSRLWASVLSDAELQRADRFAAEDDKAQFEQRRAFRRFCGATALGSSQSLSEIVFEETENGRPFLSESPDCCFSFSSCRFGVIGAWSSTHAIGVDVEDHTKELEATELAQQFFSVAEVKAVEAAAASNRLLIFYQLWTLKEAALKSIGEGLPFGLDAFEFELGPRLRVAHAPPDHGGPERFNAYVIEGTDACAALVIRSST
ncbi:MAG: 4'-phosphopantetheinyl transferase superfamily protein [Deltaproteobacteria bacterium]|nr:4'-phosphopantetheinyl transferase superfamily protein [Deltaproteobacteria bacterium]